MLSTARSSGRLGSVEVRVSSARSSYISYLPLSSLVIVQVHGWIYTLDTGRLRDLRISVGPDGPITVYHSTED